MKNSYFSFKKLWIGIIGGLIIVFFIVLIINTLIKQGEVRSSIIEIPMYETFESENTFPGIDGNKFEKFVTFTFTKDNREFNVDGFYTGNDKWCVRFMPDETGVWTYNWKFEGKNGKGRFICTERKNSNNHGHVKRDPDHQRYLVYDDGTPHYWYGGKWINVLNYGPESKSGEINNEHLKDIVFLSYLDTMKRYRHNGLLLKNALFPLENDKISWDIEWIGRGEWLVKQMAERGIYCQVNFFDTWSRDREKWFSNNTDGTKQVLNVWDSTDLHAKENYIRTIIARYSGFYNVYWELGNEMEHRPNNGSDFISLANGKYIPWIRKYDPYFLPICLSEEIWKKADVEIGLIHQTDRFPEFITSGDRPNMINELVRGGIKEILARDAAIRDSTERLSYRRTFWRYFTYGGCGSTEATWLKLTEPLNEAVLNVMGDQMRLRDFIDQLPVNINQMNTDTSFIENGPGSFRTRRKTGECYVTYFLLDPDRSAREGTVRMKLSPGSFEIRWYDPAAGRFSAAEKINSTGNAVIINHPAFREDIVLQVTKI